MFSLRKSQWAWLPALAVLAFAGCAGDSSDEHAGHDHEDGDHDHDHSQRAKAADPSMTPSPELAEFVVAGGDPGTSPTAVGAARVDVQSGQEVAVVGRIKDFVPGTTAFTLVDSKIPACSDIPGDACETPWDYCCEPPENLIANMITVQLVNEEGAARKGNLKGVSSVDNLTTVVVTGVAEKDATGNVNVKASKLIVQN